MPNHVTTRCTITGPDDLTAAFRARMIVEKVDDQSKARETYSAFDFDKIIPMPASAAAVELVGNVADVLAILTDSSVSYEIWQQQRRFDHDDKLGAWKGKLHYEKGEIPQRLEEFSPGCIERARKMALCFGETGFTSWYDWSIANWGTKWNSYSFTLVNEEPLQVTFETAWAFPEPVFRALAAEYPDLRFDCVTFDEGSNFAGKGVFHGADPSATWALCDATDDLYREVYGRERERDEEDE